MTDHLEGYREELREFRAQIEEAIARTNAVRDQRDGVIRQAISNGMAWAEVRKLAGISTVAVGKIHDKREIPPPK